MSRVLWRNGGGDPVAKSQADIGLWVLPKMGNAEGVADSCWAAQTCAWSRSIVLMHAFFEQMREAVLIRPTARSATPFPLCVLGAHGVSLIPLLRQYRVNSGPISSESTRRDLSWTVE